jgi:hypothetical protein
MCILLHFFICVGIGKASSTPGSPSTKSFTVIQLSPRVITITKLARFGAGNAPLLCNKEAANSSMTTLFDSPCHFPKIYSGWRIGIFFCLS